MRKLLLWSLGGIGIIILLAVGAGLYITYNYENVVKNVIVKELNKYIDNTEISVGDINFSIFKKFPDASIEFIDISAKFPKNFDRSSFPKLKDDTLFTAKSLFFQFNILDIFRNNYKINEIEIKKAKAIILIDKNGKDNFHFWKTTSGVPVSSNFKLELKKLKFIEMKFIFQNLAKNLEIKAHTNKLELHGDFSSDSYAMSTLGNVVLDRFMLDNVNYINANNISLKLNLDVNNNQYIIKKGEVKTSDLKFNVTGKYIYSETDKINLKISGNNIDIESFISLLPDKYKNEFNDYKSKGNFYFNAIVTGNISRLITPHIEVKFGISDGIVNKSNSDIKLYNINIDGLYSNGINNNLQNSILKLNKFSAKLGNSKIDGIYIVDNFTNPKIRLEAEVGLNLAEMQEFFHFDTIKNISGIINANIKFSGNVKAIDNFTKEDFQNATTEGKIIVNNGNISFIKSIYTYSNINGAFSFRNNDISVDSATFNINKNDFYIKGYLKNIISYIMIDNEKLYAEANVKSSYLDLDDLLQSDPNKSSSTNSAFGFPVSESFKININVKHFIESKFNAHNVTGFIDYNNKILTAQNLSFETMDGKILANGVIKQLENKQFIMQWESKMNDVDIKKLFYTFDNFNQTFILDKHLKGKVNAKVDFSSEWSKNFDINYDKLIAQGNIEILNGELINFEPMLKLSDYISVSELKNIKFSKMKNDIYIKDRKVTIPQMTINTSAINIDLSGEHYFNNDILYHLKVLLSDVLSKKAKKAKKENEEFGVEEDDGSGKTSLYLLIKGNTDNYKVTYDVKNAKKSVKQNFEEEKQNLKTILHKEFGLFKNDSVIIKNEKNKKQENKKKKSNFTIEWDNDTIK